MMDLIVASSSRVTMICRTNVYTLLGGFIRSRITLKRHYNRVSKEEQPFNVIQYLVLYA